MSAAGGLEVGVCFLPEVDWPAEAQRWQRAEELGATTAWVYDHLSWRSLRDGPWLGAVPLLAAVAAATRTMRLGFLVATPNFRHPVPFAKDLMTLDRISGGRLDVGLGSGGTGADATVLGADVLSPAERMSRFEEFVAGLDVVLTEPASATVHGTWFDAVDARTLPGCRQQPRVPFTVAATGPRGLRLAASSARTWVTYGPGDGSGDDDPSQWWAGVDRQRVALDEACQAVGRDPATIRRMALVGLTLDWAARDPASWDDFSARLLASGFTDVALHWPRPQDPSLPGPPMHVLEHALASAAH